MAGRVLTIAESDSSGSGGVQADIKTVLALGGYATTALTGITAQDTGGVSTFQMLDPDIVAEQMKRVLEDIGTDAIKTGILNHEIIVDAVADILDAYQHKHYPVVVDPSLVTSGGHALVDESAIPAIKRRMFVRASVLTPNRREAELLTGMDIQSEDDIHKAADMMRSFGADAVLLKAGRMPNNKELYLVATATEDRIYERPYIETPHTLGAGNTLASALAISLAQGMPLFPAIERSLDFLHQAILHAPGYGKKRGPINHAFHIERSVGSFHPESITAHKP